MQKKHHKNKQASQCATVFVTILIGNIDHVGDRGMMWRDISSLM